MKKITLILFALFTCLQINAQVSSYSFSQSTGTYTEITGGTVLGIATNDDTSFNAQTIGFSFVYNGVTYTQFSVNSNGFIALGATAVSSYTALSTGTSNNVISALNGDLNGSATGELSYQLSGTAPNQVLTIQWKNYRHYNATGDVNNFQIKLYETTNVVEVVYGAFTQNGTTRTRQVGLRGASSADFNNRTTTTNWSATTAGATNVASCSLTTAVVPTSGLTFTWSPPSCAAPGGFAVSSLTSTSATISWNAAVPVPGTGYEYYYSDVNTAPAGAGTANSGLTANLSALTPNTTYYVWLRSDCGGGTFSAWAGPFTFATPCNPYTVPYFEGFESGYTHNTTVAGCISQASVTGTQVWTANSTFTDYNRTPRTGSFNAFLRYSNEDWMFIPIDLVGGTSYRVSLYARQDGATSTDANIAISYGTSNTAVGMTNSVLAATGIISGNYQEIVGDFTPATSGTYYVGIKGYMNGTPWYISLDDISITESPSCLNPNTIIASNITSNSVDLSWTDGSGGLQFDYEYVIQAPGTGEPTGAGAQIGDVTVVGESFDIDGNPLTPNTLYEVYVRADCGGGSFSTWSGPITFRTLCESINTFPFTETFEDVSTSRDCWSNIQEVGTSDWTYNTGSSGGAISTAFQGTLNARFVSTTGTASPITKLVSPVFDFSSLTSPRLKFNYGQENWFGDQNELKVYYRISPSDPWVEIGYYSSNITSWTEVVLSLPNPSATYQIAFEGINNFGRANVVDNVTIEETPSCVEPNTILASNVTSSTVDLSWTDGSGGAQSNYEYAIQAPGTGIPAGAGAQVADVTIVGEGFDINGDPLAANTTYEVYVRADCGGGDFSPWIGPITFTTLCDTFVAPYTEDFENAGAIPSCWNMSGSENWLFSNDPGFNHIGNNGVITGSTISGGYFAWVDDSTPNTTNATLTSPMIDVSALAVPRLTFFELSNNEGANPNSTLNVEVWDGAAWNPMATYNTNTNGWEKRVIDLSSLTITGNVQVRFIIVESSSFYDDIAIDDVTIEETPSCLEPTLFSVDTVGTDSVTVSWTAGATETEWEYVIQAQGTGVPSGAGVSTTSNPLVISGLTPNTPYEIYLRAVCSVTEQSIWVGPFNVETNIEVVCGTPVNTTYCYTDNDSTSWTFTSSDGSPLRVNFIAGQVEVNWDELIVIDSDGVTQLYNGYGTSGNLAGLTFDSTGDTITVMISADGSTNCGDSAYTSWDFDVVCATCVNPTATYTIVPDCANAQYSIDVDVTNLGTATSLTISDGTTTLTAIAATGVQTFGPYADGATTTITITNEQDGACSVTSGTLINVCPPSNDECVNAIPVDCGDVVTGSTANGATNSGNNSSADVWYSYSGAAGDITISLCNNTNFDSYLRVFDACGGTEIAFNDDGCAAQSTLTFTADGVSTYYIMVEGFGANNGNFEMAVTCVLSNGDFDANSFSAYPNPVKDVLNISYATEISSIRVINMIGQEVLSKNINATSSQVDMSQLSAGTYIVNVTLGDTIKTLKVVKQ